MRVITFFACLVLVCANTDENEFARSTVIDEGNRTVIVTVDQPVTLSCSFKLNGEESYEWEKDDGTVKGKKTNNKSDNEVQMSLDIANVTPEDGGDYRCIAVGSEKRTGFITLRIADVSDVTMNVSESLGSVHLKWTVKENKPEYYRVEYTLINNTKFWSDKIPSEKSEYQLEGLQSNIQYRFRLHALDDTDNQTQISPYSQWVNITESKFIPIVNIVSSTKNSIKIQWSRPSDESGHKVDNYRIFVNDNKPVTKVSSDNVHEFENLDCSENYTIQVESCKTDSHLNGKSLPVYGRTLDCANNSAADFGPQMNMVLVIMLALYLSTKYYA